MNVPTVARLGSCALFFSILLAVPGFAAPLINGSFESPVISSGRGEYSVGTDLGGWTVVGDAGGTIFVLPNTYSDIGGTYGAIDGVNHLDLTGYLGSARAGVAQTTITQVGYLYQLTFYTGDINNGVLPNPGGVELFIDGLSQGLFTVTAPSGGTTTTWQQFTVSFVATNAATEIRFLRLPSSSLPDEYGALDNVTLTEVGDASVPEPETAFFTAAGLAIMAIRRARNR